MCSTAAMTSEGQETANAFHEHGKGTFKSTPPTDRTPTPERYAPLDSGWGWICVLGSFVIYMIAGGLNFRGSGIIFVAIIDYYDASAAETSWVTSLMFALTFALAPVGNYLAVRFGTRPVVFIAGLLVGGGLVSSSLVTDVEHMYGTYSLLLGVGNSFIFTTCIGHVALYFEKRLSMAIGISLTGSGFGTLIAGPLTTALEDEYGLSGAFLILGGISLNICPCALLLRPLSFYEPKRNKLDAHQDVRKYNTAENNKQKPQSIEKVEVNNNSTWKTQPFMSSLSDLRKPSTVQFHPESIIKTTGAQVDTDSGLVVKEGQLIPSVTSSVPFIEVVPLAPLVGSDDVAGDSEQKASGPKFNWHVLALGKFWLSGLTMMLSFMAYCNVGSIFIPAHADALGLEDDQYSLLITIMGAVEIAGRLFIGWLSDLKIVKVGNIFVGVSLVIGIMLFIVPIAGTDFNSLAMISAVFTLAGCCLSPLEATILLERLGPNNLPAAIGFGQFLAGLAFLASQPTAGYLFESTGSWATAFYIHGGAGLISAMAVAIYEIIEYISGLKKKSKVHFMI